MTTAGVATQLLEHVNDGNDGAIRRLLAAGARISLGETGPDHVYESDAGLRRFLRALRRGMPRYTVAADRVTETENGAVVLWEAIGTSTHGEVLEAAGTLAIDIERGRISGIRVRTRDTGLISSGERMVA
jgi:hypothetical protein